MESCRWAQVVLIGIGSREMWADKSESDVGFGMGHRIQHIREVCTAI
jgi:hypothetical protein